MPITLHGKGGKNKPRKKKKKKSSSPKPVDANAAIKSAAKSRAANFARSKAERLQKQNHKKGSGLEVGGVKMVRDPKTGKVVSEAQASRSALKERVQVNPVGNASSEQSSGLRDPSEFGTGLLPDAGAGVNNPLQDAITLSTYTRSREQIEQPGGWKNVKATYLALNPFNRQPVYAHPNNPLRGGLEAFANNPETAAAILTVPFMLGGVSAAGGGAAAAGSAGTKVAQAGVVGKAAPYTVVSTASTIAVNTASKKATASMLTKMLPAATKSGPLVVGGLMASIGTYPFAGFIKEEALQTLSLGYNDAMRNGNLEGAQEALDLQRDILHPDMWDRILNSIPFVNTLNQLQSFYRAAELKVGINQMALEDQRNKTESGLSDADILQQRRDQEQAEIDAFNERRIETEQILLEMRAAAAAQGRKDFLKSLDKQLAKKAKFEEEQRRLNALYWEEYYKMKAALAVNQSSVRDVPSKLNFGLL